jgi:predicted ATPase
LFIITGGPGSGKSTLIDALGARGIARTVEAGRAIIQNQMAIGGCALPWCDPRAFAELMLSWELRSYRWAQQQNGTIVFDRGVPDVVGYLRLMNLPVPAYMDKAARTFRYNRQVFIAPPWPEIFVQDHERKQSFNEAERTYRAMVETYAAYGYELVRLPLVSVDERACFVMRLIGS